MSTKRIRMALAAMRSCILSGEPWSQRMQADYINATADLESIEQVARDLTRLHLGDYVYRVRDSHKVLAETPRDGDTWEHPDVKAWSDAAEMLAEVAKESK